MELVIFLYFFIALYLVVQKKLKISNALLPLLLFSILVTVAMAQNYTQSLIPEANDGLGVSNKLTYFFLGGNRWSQELFQSSYDYSTNASLALLITYTLVLMVEKVQGGKQEDIN